MMMSLVFCFVFFSLFVFQVMSEAQVFEAACSWLQYDPGKRLDRSCVILQNIRLALLERHFLENVVLKSEYFRTCHKCQLLISKAITVKLDSNELESVVPRAQPPCIYVMGGRNSTDSQLRSMEKYDFLLDQWIQMVILIRNSLFICTVALLSGFCNSIISTLSHIFSLMGGQ